MLEHGTPEAKAFLSQREKARAALWRCQCGCASINLVIDGLPEPSGTPYILEDFLFRANDELRGAFVFEKSCVLAGLEVYGLAGEAPKALPLPA